MRSSSQSLAGDWRSGSWLAKALSVGLIAVAGGCSSGGQESTALSTADVAAIRRLDEAYVTAWRENDPAAIMAALTEDAVLMPHHGVPPVEGQAAIREFFWPPDSPPTTVTEFTRIPDEIAGSGDLAYVRGRFSLTFTTQTEGEEQTMSNQGNYLIVVRKEADASWRIARSIWNDPVPEAQ